MNIAITGIGLTSGLGDGADVHVEKISAGQHALRPLSGLFGDDSKHAGLNASWIENRKLMLSRKWAPASMLSLHVAKQAIADAGLTQEELNGAAVIVGSSRGNVAGWVSEWPTRRPFNLMAASNSMHGELASAVSIELGIKGPWQVISSGCAASLDAMGMAWMMMRQGIVKRAIVIGVELPLIPEVLQAYERTGVLATGSVNDPYSPEAGGFFPGEAGAAVILESVDAICERRKAMEPAYPGGHLTSKISNEDQANTMIQMTGYWCNSDADSPIGMPNDGAGLRDCLIKAIDDLTDQPRIAAICPHASGTLLHGKAELAALRAALPDDRTISLHPLKPFTGHTVGASGILDVAILARYLRDQKLPPNLPGNTCPGERFTLSPNKLSNEGSTVLKISVGMGGHNSIISLRSPSV
ncbi:MAG: beta-ketoacyl synthase N-terminal-like domain-containing protein [Akkermansiaceae bacterium]|jgi:3-oxoacyl-[acyl-carrier-protein] synthase II|tara:strand:+ start:6859 stop:8097 length:1239 start_codon:yes stop_codon:yes gene_type:complete